MSQYNKENNQTQSSTLYIVPTPIGQYADISLRALDTLRSVDVIAAEDTRRTGQLLAHFEIKQSMLSLHSHNEHARIHELVKRLSDGQSVALVSDAGTPLISDPGDILVRSVREAGFDVVPLPGPCAAICALSASGLSSRTFHFEGFIPAKGQARRDALEALKSCNSTLIFYESTHRIGSFIDLALEVFGASRQATVARELTKLHEQIVQSDLASLAQQLQAASIPSKGEFVVIIEGAPKAQALISSCARETMKILLEDMPLKVASRIASQLLPDSKKELYAMGLSLKDEPLS